MAIGKGSGKIILIGEHFVVYGAPALAAGMRDGLTAELVRADQDRFRKSEYTQNALKALNEIKHSFGIESGIEILRIDSELPVGAGLGSSAAMSVALARAVSNEFDLNASDEKISEVAYSAEKVFHGRPSGIDNTVSTFGGLIRFEKRIDQGKPNLIEPLRIPKDIEILVIHSGKVGITKDQVEKVGQFKKSNEDRFNDVLQAATNLVNEAQSALIHGDQETLGKCMSQSHEYLNAVGASSQELDEIVSTCLSQKALGAKLSGAGGGGCAIALFANQDELIKAQEVLKTKGYESFATQIQSN